MKKNQTQTLAAATLFVSALWIFSVQGGGISLYEIATPDVGLAAAGYAARAEDASTLFKNPAGMSYLQKPEVQVGAQLTYGSVTFSPDQNTSTTGSDGGNAIGALPAGGLFIVVPLSEKFAVGLGGLSYFGLVEKYDEDWVGRYFIQESMLVGMSILPSVSYKPTDWLAIGAGLNAMYGLFDADVAVNNLDPRIGDGKMSLKDEVWGFGADLGVLIEPVKGTRVGVTYLSPVDLDFEDNPSFSNLGPGLSRLLENPRQVDLGVRAPQSVMLSIYQGLGSKWALMANVGWQNWDQFGKVEVGVEGDQVTTIDANYQDTWHGALGVQFRASKKWTLTAGVAYDTSAVKAADRTVSVPMGETWRFGLGAFWHLSERVSLGAAYEFLWGGNMPVDQGSETSLRGRVSGTFDDSWFSFCTLSLNWTF